MKKIDELCKNHCYKYSYITINKKENIEIILNFTNILEHNNIMNQLDNLCQDILMYVNFLNIK